MDKIFDPHKRVNNPKIEVIHSEIRLQKSNVSNP